MPLKRIFFEDLDKNHADLVIKLRTMGLTQKDFFQHVVAAFVSNHPDLDAYFRSLVDAKSRLGKRPRNKVFKAQEDGRNLADKFGLTEGEKSDIFDILEAENFDS